jgi:hypothetical protein
MDAMPLRDLCRLALLLTTLQATMVANADTWRPATTQTYTSSDDAWQLTIEPSVSSDQGAHVGDQTAGEDRSGEVANDARTSARGTMEHCIGGRCRRAWQHHLLNDVAPVSVLVTDSGYVMTLDNWVSMGFGPHAVVLYDPAGSLIAKYALVDFLPREYVMALPRSVSSLHWRDSPRIDRDGIRIVVPVVVPSEGAEEEDDTHTQFVDVVFDPRDGSVALPAPEVWMPAQKEAATALATQRALLADELEQAIVPLLPPDSREPLDWHVYLREAFSRLDEDEAGFPATFVVPSPADPGYAKEVGRLHARLQDAKARDVIMLGALSQDTLLDLLKQEAASFHPGMRAWPRLYLLLDAERFAQASALLAPSGATLIQLDPARAIPQRADYLEAWEDYLQGRPDEE